MMIKKLITASSAPGKRIKKRKLSIGRAIKDSEIDYSDIPQLTDEQLAQFKRVGRPILGESTRKAISIRIDQDVLKKLKSQAKKSGIPYQSLINNILKKAV